MHRLDTQSIPALPAVTTFSDGRRMKNIVPGKHCSIDEMEQLINQIDEFEQLLSHTKNFNDPALKQEYRLFNQYIRWRMEDINEDIRWAMSSYTL